MRGGARCEEGREKELVQHADSISNKFIVKVRNNPHT